MEVKDRQSRKRKGRLQTPFNFGKTALRIALKAHAQFGKMQRIAIQSPDDRICFSPKRGQIFPDFYFHSQCSTLYFGRASPSANRFRNDPLPDYFDKFKGWAAPLQKQFGRNFFEVLIC